MDKNIKRYRSFIESRKRRVLPLGTLVESHHIRPRSMGGKDELENLIDLTFREHYTAHFLLWKAYGDKMARAFFLMTHIPKYASRLSSRQYSKLREEFCIRSSELNMGKTMSTQAKRKLSEYRIGRIWIHRGFERKQIYSPELEFYLKLGWEKGSGNAPMKGKKLTEETKVKISESMKNSEKVKQALAVFKGKPSWNAGKTLSEDYRKKLSESHKGTKMPESHRIHTAEARRGKLWVKKDGVSKVILPEQLPEFLLNGWERGKTHTKKSIFGS